MILTKHPRKKSPKISTDRIFFSTLNPILIHIVYIYCSCGYPKPRSATIPRSGSVPCQRSIPVRAAGAGAAELGGRPLLRGWSQESCRKAIGNPSENDDWTILATKKRAGISWNWYVDAYLPWLRFGLIRGGSAWEIHGQTETPRRHQAAPLHGRHLPWWWNIYWTPQ